MPIREQNAERLPFPPGSVEHMPPLTVTPGLRVAMVLQRFRPEFSGQGIQMEQLCQALARRGTSPIVLSSTRGRASHWEDCDGYRIRRLRTDLLPGSANRSHLWMPTFGLRVLLELLRLDRVDVVHVHGLNDGIYGAYAFCRMRGTPLVFEMTLMGVDDPVSVFAARRFMARARHRAYRNCDAYVAMSRAFLPSYSAAGMPASRLHVIPQGVDTHRFRPMSTDLRASVRAGIGCSPSAPVVAFAGSLIERKGIDVLLAAWERIHARLPQARLLLIGPDDFPAGSADRPFLEAQLARVSSAARAAVHRLGLRSDLEQLLGAADLFAFPSRREGFGSVIIEAMASGLPCVVARLDGITDFLFSSPIPAKLLVPSVLGDGVVIPQDDPGALADAALSLLSAPNWAGQIAAAGLRTARERFDLDRAIAPAYERLYTGLVDARQGS